jgi:hypothetical protein
MEWTLDTGRLGAAGCDAKDLRDHLEDALEHHAKTAPEAAESDVMRSLNGELQRVDGTAFARHASEKAAEANAAKSVVLAKLPAVQKQMRACIDAACAIAESMGGQVTATVKGHHYPEHPLGIFKRVQIGVERAMPTEDD